MEAHGVSDCEAGKIGGSGREVSGKIEEPRPLGIKDTFFVNIRMHHHCS